MIGYAAWSLVGFHLCCVMRQFVFRSSPLGLARDRDTLGNFGFRWGLGIRIPSSVCRESTSTCVNKQFAIFVKQVSIEHRNTSVAIKINVRESNYRSATRCNILEIFLDSIMRTRDSDLTKSHLFIILITVHSKSFAESIS